MEHPFEASLWPIFLPSRTAPLKPNSSSHMSESASELASEATYRWDVLGINHWLRLTSSIGRVDISQVLLSAISEPAVRVFGKALFWSACYPYSSCYIRVPCDFHHGSSVILGAGAHWCLHSVLHQPLLDAPLHLGWVVGILAAYWHRICEYKYAGSLK